MEDNSSREVAGGEGQQQKSSGESPDGVRALKVPKSDAGSSQDETPGKDKTDLSEYSVETIDIINDNTWA